MAVLKSVENGVQAKSVIESFLAEGYEREHIHIFAHSDKRAEDIANFFEVDAGAAGEATGSTGFFESIKNLFQPTPDSLSGQLEAIGVSASDQNIAQSELDAGKLVIVAHKK